MFPFNSSIQTAWFGNVEPRFCLHVSKKMFSTNCAALTQVWCGTTCDCKNHRIDVPTARDKAQALHLRVGMIWGLRKPKARIKQGAKNCVVVSRVNGPDCLPKAAHWRRLRGPSVVLSNWSGRSIINQYSSACCRTADGSVHHTRNEWQNE